MTANAPTRRIVLAIVSFAAGLFLASLVGAAVLAATDWQVGVSSAVGAEVGRAAMQIGQGLELQDFRIPTAVLVVFNVPLWMCLVGGPLLARREGLDWHDDLGWSMRRIDVPIGLALGVGAQAALIPLYQVVFWLAGEQDVDGVARDLLASTKTPLDVVALVVMTVVAAPIAEEILFRGLLYRGIRDMESVVHRSGVTVAVIASAVVFGISHFQLIQFPGLMFFGVVAAVAFQRTGRLGTSIWTHVGFNLTTVVVLLAA